MPEDLEQVDIYIRCHNVCSGWTHPNLWLDEVRGTCGCIIAEAWWRLPQPLQRSTTSWPIPML